MKIMIIPSWFASGEFPYSGIFFVEQAAALSRKHDVKIVEFTEYPFRRFPMFFKNGGGHVRESEISGVASLQTGCWPLLPHVPAVLLRAYRSAVQRVMAHLQHQGWIPDVVHAHSAYPAGRWAHYISRMNGIPYVITEHRSNIGVLLKQPELSRQLREWFAAAESVLAVSPAMQDTLRDAGITESIMVPNAVDTDFFQPLPRNAGPRESIKLLYVGSLLPIKGVDVLLDCIPRIEKDIGRPVTLDIVGEGPMRTVLEQRSEELALQRKCRFTGAVGRNEVRTLMQVADVFILPSRKETFGIVLVEAMSCGVPVVATRCGGPELIVKEFNGILCSVDNKDELGRSIAHVILNKDAYDPMRIREHAVRHYGTEKMVDTLSGIYRRCRRASN